MSRYKIFLINIVKKKEMIRKKCEIKKLKSSTKRIQMILTENYYHCCLMSHLLRDRNCYRRYSITTHATIFQIYIVKNK